MKLSRKDFLRFAAGTLVVAGAGSLVHAVGGEGEKGAEQGKRGKRWGMAIDIRACREERGCDACIRACHTSHNVPSVPDGTREVKWIWNEPAEHVFPYHQNEFTGGTSTGTLPVLCNHCTSPGCTRVCPTKATWKRDDGVVMMDYHRCIGCRYCMAACPYGSRSFNFSDPRPHIAAVNPKFPTRSAGVVEKCNLCEERLAEGQLPACVEACPKQALIFGDLNDEQSALRQMLRTRFAVQRQPELGCGPNIFYLVG